MRPHVLGGNDTDRSVDARAARPLRSSGPPRPRRRSLHGGGSRRRRAWCASARTGTTPPCRLRRCDGAVRIDDLDRALEQVGAVAQDGDAHRSRARCGGLGCGVLGLVEAAHGYRLATREAAGGQCRRGAGGNRGLDGVRVGAVRVDPRTTSCAKDAGKGAQAHPGVDAGLGVPMDHDAAAGGVGVDVVTLGHGRAAFGRRVNANGRCAAAHPPARCRCRGGSTRAISLAACSLWGTSSPHSSSATGRRGPSRGIPWA